MSDKLFISWEQIEIDCLKASKKIKKPVDVVVAITKGGLPIAAIIANKYLNHPPVITLQIKEIVAEGKANYQTKTIQIVAPLNPFPLHRKHILIVDDVADSGKTLKATVKLIKTKKPKSITTLCLHYKSRTSVKPNIYVNKVRSQTWIVYPWESLAKQP